MYKPGNTPTHADPTPPPTIYTQDKSVKAWDLRSPKIGDCARLLDAMPHAALSLAWLPHPSGGEQVLALGALLWAWLEVFFLPLGLGRSTSLALRWDTTTPKTNNTKHPYTHTQGWRTGAWP